MLTHSFIKKRSFYGLCKKGKTCHEKAYFNTKFFSFLHWPHKNSFFSKPLRGNLGHGVVQITFLFEFFDIFKYVKNVFHKKKAYAPKTSYPYKIHI
jgi:hypothetical protein